MKTNKRFVSVFLALLMVFGVLSVSLISVSAVTVIDDDDFSLVKNSDGTYSVYSYNGDDTDITLPTKAFGKNVTGIYQHAFEDSTINSITIPEGYTTIGVSAFYGCTNITSITLPSTITSLGNMAFNSCTSLSSIDLSAAASLTTIPYAVFQGDTALKSISIPANITTISNNAFARTGLTSITISNTVETLGANVFMGSSSLTTAVLPEGLTSLQAYLFDGCTSLENVTIPSTVTEIQNNVFASCTSLETVNLPEDLEIIGDEAFSGCTSLSDIELPNSLTTIGTSAFENDSSLTAITIPANVDNIGGNAFYPMSVQNKLTVTCYEGSAAETYCDENYVKSSVQDKVIGDANGDGECNILDVSAIQKYRIGEQHLSQYGLICADVNNKDEVTIRDATLIQMKLAMIDVGF